MRDFGLSCLSRCHDDSKKQPPMLIFQSLAACYSIFFVGSFFVFTRPGAALASDCARPQPAPLTLPTDPDH